MKRQMESVEQVVKAISHPTVEVRVLEASFNRSIYFKVNSEEYLIEWWCNLCYLYAGDLLVIFDTVKVDSTWPNRAKMNLQFYYNGEICAIIPIEYWS